MKFVGIIIGFLAGLGAVAAQPVTMQWSPPAGPLVSGAEATVELVALNRGPAEQAFTAPTAILAELTVGAQSRAVELTQIAGADGSGRLAPGGFVTRTYRFVVPAGLEGQAVLAARFSAAALPVRGVLDLQPPTAAAAEKTADRPVTKPTTNLVRAEPAASIIQRTFAQRLAPHEPVYFIYGAKGPAAKFQLSFKYKVLQFTDLDRGRRARTLQFGFTQRSLWDLDSESSPFYDTSYMPEVFYESLAPKPEDRDTWFTWLGYQAGVKHESNGRDGPVSRSLNTVFLRPVFGFGQLDEWHLLVVPEFYTYVDSLEDNRELKDYRGYGRLTLVFGRNDGPSLMATMWAGKNLKRQSFQLDFTQPLKTKLLDFETYLLVQYFHGYGESLLSFREKSETLRAGFSLVR